MDVQAPQAVVIPCTRCGAQACTLELPPIPDDVAGVSFADLYGAVRSFLRMRQAFSFGRGEKLELPDLSPDVHPLALVQPAALAELLHVVCAACTRIPD